MRPVNPINSQLGVVTRSQEQATAASAQTQEDDMQQQRPNSMAPPLQHYDGTTDPGMWILNFEAAVKTCNWTPEMQPSFFQMYMAGKAQFWITALTAAVRDNVGELKKGLIERFQTLGKNKYEMMDLFNHRKQHDGENVEDYIEEMQRRGHCLGKEEPDILDQIILGLRPSLKQLVLTKEPTSVAEVLKYAKMVQVEVQQPGSSNIELAILTMQQQLKGMTQKMEQVLDGQQHEVCVTKENSKGHDQSANHFQNSNRQRGPNNQNGWYNQGSPNNQSDLYKQGGPNNQNGWYSQGALTTKMAGTTRETPTTKMAGMDRESITTKMADKDGEIQTMHPVTGAIYSTGHKIAHIGIQYVLHAKG